MNHFLPIPLLVCLALCAISPRAQAQSCDSLAYFTWEAQCNSVTFTPAYLTPGATYTWAFGDGSSSNEISPSHVYFTQIDTQYTTVLTVVSGNCTKKDTVAITVDIVAGELPFASMMSLGVGAVLKGEFLHCNASFSNPVFNLTVQNTSQNVPPNTSYRIDWGDGTPISMPVLFATISHQYSSMGLYHIDLLAESLNGCVDSAQYTFFNGREPAAGIGIPPSANFCCAPAQIHFETIPSAASNPPGTYYIYSVETGCEPLFSDTIPHTFPLTQFTYTFNRGSCEPECILPDNPGSFRVYMTAVNACGTQESYTAPRISSKIVTEYEASAGSVVGNTLCFVNTSQGYYWNQFNSGCASDLILHWKIDPPIGFSVVSGELGIPQFSLTGSDTLCLRFDSAGHYVVELRADYPPVVATGACCRDTAIKSIQIVPPCDSLAVFDWSVQCNTATFRPLYPDSTAVYQWTFGDGAGSTAVLPTHTFFAADTAETHQYKVVLSVTQGVCTVSDSAVFTLNLPTGQLPVASMVSLGIGTQLQQAYTHCQASSGNPAFTLTVQNASQNTVDSTSYQIFWGDGTSTSYPTSLATASHNYAAMGMYNIVLRVQNPTGCADSAQYVFFNGREPAAGIGIPIGIDLCAPTEIEFLHTAGVQSSPPGTQYIYSVETGCDPVHSDTIPHANPLIPFSYLFNRGSCEPDCITPDNPGAFTISMTAINTCGSNQAQVSVRIASPLQTSFEALEVVSIGDTVCLANTSKTYYWDANEQECSSDVALQWSLSPSSGFTVESGTLSSDTVCIRFYQTGVYSVTLNATRPNALLCDADSSLFMRTISVNTVSASEQATDRQIRIVPNPTTGKCSLLADASMEVLSVDVYNLLGQWLTAHTFSQRPYFLENTSLGPGQYLLRIHLNGNRYMVKKLIVF